jgi:hypothetical protein
MVFRVRNKNPAARHDTQRGWGLRSGEHIANREERMSGPHTLPLWLTVSLLLPQTIAAAQRPPAPQRDTAKARVVAAPAARPRTTVRAWLRAGLTKDHPAFLEAEPGYLPANLGIARRSRTPGIAPRVQRMLLNERRSRMWMYGQRRPSDADVRAHRLRDDQSVQRANQALKEARAELRRPAEANDQQALLALHLRLVEQASRQPRDARP